MIVVFLVVLAAYLAHAIAMHRQAGPEEPDQETQLHRGMPAPAMPMALFLACQALAMPSIEAAVHSPWTWAGAGALLLLMLLNQLRRNKSEGDDAGPGAQLFYVSGGLLQSILLVLACYYAFYEGVLGRSLFEPQWVIIGLVAGHVVFGISLLFSHRSLETIADIGGYLVDWRPLGRFLARSPRQIFACLDISLIEELVYRVACQGMLFAVTGNPWIAIVVTALVFSVVHRHFFYNHVVDSIEFLAFSLLLGILYHATGSLMLVVLIHTVRNLEIVYFDDAADATDEEATRPGTAVLQSAGYNRGLMLHGR